MELIKIGITETAPVPDSFGRAGGACTLSFGSVWTEIQIMIFLHYLKMLFGETLRYSFQFHW